MVLAEFAARLSTLLLHGFIDLSDLCAGHLDLLFAFNHDTLLILQSCSHLYQLRLVVFLFRLKLLHGRLPVSDLVLGLDRVLLLLSLLTL